jgi:hypothetical protein
MDPSGNSVKKKRLPGAKFAELVVAEGKDIRIS